MINDIKQFCPYCGTAVDQTYAFCPHCGKSLEILHGITVGKQIYLYLMSIFMPPMGIVYGMRYMKSSNPHVKLIGIVTTILTLLSLAFSVWFILILVHQFQSALDTYGNLGM